MGIVNAKEIPVHHTIQPNAKLGNVARVDKVHIGGIRRTKDKVLQKAVQELFKASNYEQVFINAYTVKYQLERLGAFKNIEIYIETSNGPDATPNGLEVTYKVLEFDRVKAGFNTELGNNEGSVGFGANFPNLFGRGESLQTEYQYGIKNSSNFNISLAKPFFFYGNPRITANIFQQAGDSFWSGFHEIDKGLLLDILLQTAPNVNHSIRWEGIWRQLKCLSPVTSFSVREEMGHSLKSSIKHVLTVDKRDNSILPNFGTYFKLTNEYAGLGGNVGFLKHEMEYQLNQRLGRYFVVQGSAMAGLMHKAGVNKNYCITDRFFLGGPLNLRGYSLRGVGPHSEGNALGAEGYWASALHLYTPLPFISGRGRIIDFFKMHYFVNAGNIGTFKFSEDYYQNITMLLTNIRASCGFGLVFSFLNIARFELNYCFPLKQQPDDCLSKGLQFGFGIEFL